ncbi:AAA family ATPase [Actinoplanes awajinensis]|uniref:AAA domain-containing protein n=1 Tax=Actinoplanes awajinensis subsp. mycoplanecinus TaxID=135947 RepID=A0A101JRP1_9ACTN|nr:AAA family ATPase [Actinoplanes awajinensis]KUL31443.1 hypothetical protein ADL15_22170 [Actinoplanes awajinensis subsp. mycoplanecinus]
MTITFTPPTAAVTEALHHHQAAHGNNQAAAEAAKALTDALSATEKYDKILLRAAAGAGKTHALRHMVRQALEHPYCSRVAVTAFANKQVIPLAGTLGRELGADRVCLFVARDRLPDVPPAVRDSVSIATSTADIPASCDVIVGTSHKLGAFGEMKRLIDNLGPADNGTLPFDVLFVDEAWQLPAHRYATVAGLAPISVGVGDVGQLPPLEPGQQNPWRGDPGYNPYRAWPTAYPAGTTTRIVDLPTVWRPTTTQLPLWRAFYTDWDHLHCVAGPGDRALQLPPLTGVAASVWGAVADGSPTLLEVDGLPDPEAPDIDLPLLGVLEQLLEPLLEGGFSTVARRYNSQGVPDGETVVDSADPHGDPLIVILATRNQAVDDANDLVERLTERYDLPDGVLVASTVDSWQGQTNAITVAIHPLSGAEQLDDFNSAFGRLAVTCTRATHGLLMIARRGLDDLLDTTPARPGTPLGEPGPRSLPRQTHQRILSTFSRGLLDIPASA